MKILYQSVLLLRNRHFLLLDSLFLLVSPLLALLLRVDGWDAGLLLYVPALALYTGLLLVVRLVVFHRMGLYRRFWRYASVDDLWQILAAVALGSLLGLSSMRLRSPRSTDKRWPEFPAPATLGSLDRHAAGGGVCRLRTL